MFPYEAIKMEAINFTSHNLSQAQYERRLVPNFIFLLLSYNGFNFISSKLKFCSCLVIIITVVQLHNMYVHVLCRKHFTSRETRDPLLIIIISYTYRVTNVKGQSCMYTLRA